MWLNFKFLIIKVSFNYWKSNIFKKEKKVFLKKLKKKYLNAIDILMPLKKIYLHILKSVKHHLIKVKMIVKWVCYYKKKKN